MDFFADDAYWAEQERVEQERELAATRKGPGEGATEADWDAYYFRAEQVHDSRR